MKSSCFVRPSFHQSLRKGWEKCDSDGVAKGKRQLKDGLLKLRVVIRKEISETGKEMRQFRALRNIQLFDDPSIQTQPVFSDNDSEEENVPPQSHQGV